MQEECKIFYIKGQTQNGEIFRPSDWVERLCGIMSQFSPKSKCLSYSPYVQPAEINGVKSVKVSKDIANIEPKALDFLYNFAKSNKLPIVTLCPVTNIENLITYI